LTDKNNPRFQIGNGKKDLEVIYNEE